MAKIGDVVRYEGKEVGIIIEVVGDGYRIWNVMDDAEWGWTVSVPDVTAILSAA